jgi:hypothetical protein
LKDLDKAVRTHFQQQNLDAKLPVRSSLEKAIKDAIEEIASEADQ